MPIDSQELGVGTVVSDIFSDKNWINASILAGLQSSLATNTTEALKELLHTSRPLFTPKLLHSIDGAMTTGGRYRPAYSYRSFHYCSPQNSKTVSFKGNDFFNNGTDLRKPAGAGNPLRGAATVQELQKDFAFGNHIQSNHYKYRGEMYGLMPQPIKVIQTQEVPQQNHIPHKGQHITDYINRLSLANYHNGHRRSATVKSMEEFAHMRIPDRFNIESLLNQYINITGPHGSGMYTIDGLNIRLRDILSPLENIELATAETLVGIQSELLKLFQVQFPHISNGKELCIQLSKNLGHTWGLLHGSGIVYEEGHYETCLLGDHTIYGGKVDLGGNYKLIDTSTIKDAYVSFKLDKQSGMSNLHHSSAPLLSSLGAQYACIAEMILLVHTLFGLDDEDMIAESVQTFFTEYGDMMLSLLQAAPSDQTYVSRGIVGWIMLGHMIQLKDHKQYGQQWLLRYAKEFYSKLRQ